MSAGRRGRRRWRLTRAAALLCLLVASVVPVAAQPVNMPLLQQTLGGGETQQTLPLPQATELGPGWWRYFDVDGEALERRTEATLNALDELLTTLPAAGLAEARAQADLIRAGLKALPAARAAEPPPPPAPPAYAERYTPSEYLTLADELRELESRIAGEQADYQTGEQSLAEQLRRNDTRFAAYLKRTTDDPQRPIEGLAIMAERLALLIAAERLRLEKAALDALTLHRAQLIDELATARRRLDGDGAAFGNAERDISWSTAALAAARDKLNTALTEASLPDGEEAAGIAAGDGKASERYRQQRVVDARVGVAAARVRLLQLQMEHMLNALLLDSGGVAVRAAHDQIGDWQAELDEIMAPLDDWRQASERERRRAGALAGEEAKPLEPTSVTSLNQRRFDQAQQTLVALRRLEDRLARARLTITLIEEQLLIREGALKRWLAHAEQALARGWQGFRHGINASLFTLGDTPVTALGLLRIVLILFVAWLLSYWVRQLFGRLGRRGDGHNLPAYYTIGRLSHYVIILAGILIGLSSIGMDFTSFALVAGALAIGIGFGLQAIVNNFMSGLILLFERSLKVGDFVDLGNGTAGEVQAINVRSTQIKTNENIDIVVPNSEFMTANVINWTLQEPFLRVHYPFRVAFGEDKENVRRAGLEAAENVSHTLSGIPGKNPQVWLVGFGENGYDFELVVWLTPSAVKRPQAVRAAYYWALETALVKYHVKVPVPQRDIYLREGFGSLQGKTGGAASGRPPG